MGINDPTIERLLAALCDVIRSRVCKTNLQAIVLVGSLARGEFSGYQRRNKLVVFSDIEFVFITLMGRMVGSRSLRRALKAELLKYVEENEFAGVDFWAMTLGQFVRGDMVFFHEARANGVVLYAAKEFSWPVLPKSVDVNPVDLREICLHRAVSMLANWRCNGDLRRREEVEHLHYAISRNYLDLLTVYSYFVGARLYSYRERLDWAVNGGLNEMSPFSGEFLSDVAEATTHKLNPNALEVNKDPVSRIRQFASELSALAGRLQGSALPRAREGGRSGMNSHGKKLFLYKVYQAIRHPGQYSIRHALLDQKRELLAEGIAEMERIGAFIEESETRAEALRKLFGVDGAVDPIDVILRAAQFHYPYLRHKRVG